MFFIFKLSTQPDQHHKIKPAGNKTGYQYAKPSQRINGFKYLGYKGSKCVLSINSRNLIIHRKKIGFLRFALIKEAFLENGVIKFYSYTDINAASNKAINTASDSARDTTAFSDSGNDAATFSNADIAKSFGLMVSKKSQLLSNFKNVTSIRISPVLIEFYKDKRLMTSLSALSVTMNLFRQKIVFKQKVTVISGKRKLIVDRLEFKPGDNLITGTNYILSYPEGDITGKKIITDFNLQKIYKHRIKSGGRKYSINPL